MPLTKITQALTVDGSLSSSKLGDAAVTTEMLASDTVFPKITTVQVADSGWVVLDDTAVDINGGYIIITGSNFVSGCSTIIGTTNATSTTFISSTTLRVQVPALAAGTYDVYVTNPDGGVAIEINGLTTSSFPAWSTGSSLPDQSSGVAISINLAATSDSAVSYALAPGSNLPTGLTLSSSGLLSGTVTVEASTLYNFTVRATDAQNQNTDRAFSMYVLVITSTFAVADASWNILDDTAVDTAGGYFIITDSAGVESGATVTVGGTSATSVTYVNSSTLRVQMPAKAAGTYTVFVYNPGGSVRNGFLTFVTSPAWTTAAWLTNVLPDTAFTRNVVATGATTYSLASGSSLPAGVSLASNGTLSGTISGIVATTTYSFTIDATNSYNQNISRTFNLLVEGTIANGQQEYITPGTYTWTCPANVYKVSAVAVGGGGGGYSGSSAGINGTGGGGGGLGWKNNIAVTPGQSYTVEVGARGALQTTLLGTNKGGDSWFVSTSTVRGIGGYGGAQGSLDGTRGNGGSYVGDGGGAGGQAGNGNTTQRNGGSGGGAGGYSGTGGFGGSANTTTFGVQGGAGSGGAAGGGGCPRPLANSGQTDRAGGGGGGVGIYGQGTSGAATGNFLIPVGGNGGSGGANGSTSDPGQYGGGGAGGGGTNGNLSATQGQSGAVRIIWGSGRAWPATNTANL